MALYATIPPKMHRIFFKYDEKKNVFNQLADNDTELYSRHWMFYLYRFSPQNSKMFSSHHHKAHKFVTQNLLYIIRLKKKKEKYHNLRLTC